MSTPRSLPILIIAIMTLTSMTTAQAANEFASPAFAQQWRHDEQLAPNFWGPLTTAHSGQYEQYLGISACPRAIPCHVAPVEPTAERRLVQYFDKGRMELTVGASGGPQVTAGLLVTEMITGRVQVGETQFVDQPPAAVPVAGDTDNPFPLYRDLGAATAPATASVGAPIQLLLTPTGAGTTTAFAADPETIGSERDGQTGHTLPRAFADFRARVGIETVGLAVTEPFWANVKVAGRSQPILIQAFERRVLTYNPTNPPAFQVEFGNVGQQYYAWRAIADV